MNLSQMRAQRAKLDEQIREAETEQSANWNFALESLYDYLLAHARRRGLMITESTRKNVITVVLEGRVSVEFGHDDGEHTAFLAAGDDRGTRVEFSAPTVIESRFLDFINALLLETTETTETTPEEH